MNHLSAFISPNFLSASQNRSSKWYFPTTCLLRPQDPRIFLSTTRSWTNLRATQCPPHQSIQTATKTQLAQHRLAAVQTTFLLVSRPVRLSPDCPRLPFPVCRALHWVFDRPRAKSAGCWCLTHEAWSNILKCTPAIRFYMMCFLCSNCRPVK